MQPTAINFESLENNSSTNILRSKSFMHGWGVACLVFFVFVGIVALAFNPVVGVFFLFITTAPIFRAISKRQGQNWDQFALLNNWKLTPSNRSLIPAFVPPSLLNQGHRPAISDIISGQIYGVNFQMFVYDYTVSYGKSSVTYYDTIMSIDLPPGLPHMLLNSKKNHGGAASNSGLKQKLELEGDFDKYFELRTDEGSEVDALSIISPDVMQTLIAYEQAYDIETVNNKLFIIAVSDQRRASSIKKLFEDSERIYQDVAGNIQELFLQAGAKNPL